MAKARDDRHRYGQHYTPRDVARLLAAFAVRSADDLIFDPSCGDGRLLDEAFKLKSQLSTPGQQRRLASSPGLFGVERSAQAIKHARTTGACVAVADFFDVEPGTRMNSSGSRPGKDACAPRSLPTECDAIIGNPPYIRHEVIGSDDKRRIQARLARDRTGSPELFWPSWSGRSDIYVYFFAHSICFLRDGGRLVFITASSWLDAGYGSALREWMLRNFRIIAVIESAVESFFADASINTCITVLEREADSRAREGNSIKFVRFNRTLSEILGKESGRQSDAGRLLARKIERAEASSSNHSVRTRVISQSELLRGTKQEPQRIPRAAIERGWGKYLRADEIFFKVIARGSSRLQCLSKLARVRFGVKTGANDFFYLKEDGGSARREGKRAKGKGRRAKGERQRASGLLALADVASVRRGITTGANDFFYLSRAGARTEDKAAPASRPRGSANGLVFVRDSAGKVREIEAELLSPVVFSLKEIPGISLEGVDAQRMLFNCSLEPRELEGTRALDYIESGERAGYHRRPTCRARKPWYSVVPAMKPAPLIFPSKVGERWLVALNRARVFEDKKLYGIFPSRDVAAPVLAALLNSTWARYYAEVTCRQMTGAQAIADIDVSVAEQIMLPDPRELSESMKKKLAGTLAQLACRPVYSIFEEVKRSDRRRLDALTLEAIGFSEKPAREAALDQLYKAMTELVRARLARSHPQS